VREIASNARVTAPHLSDSAIQADPTTRVLTEHCHRSQPPSVHVTSRPGSATDSIGAEGQSHATHAARTQPERLTVTMCPTRESSTLGRLHEKRRVQPWSSRLGPELLVKPAVKALLLRWVRRGRYSG
jgi:hypothetical protein